MRLDIGGNLFNGKLKLTYDSPDIGYFDFHGQQSFPVADAFWKDNSLWVFGIGCGEGTIPIGIIPLKIQMKGKDLNGEIFRINAKIKGTMENPKK
jgi:hypothetical protein